MKNQDQFRPTCTVVICTRDRPTELNRCLEALAELDYPHFDVLVVDNAPSDDQARQVAIRWGARYVLEPRVGLSRARNRGARASGTEIVAFLDDDSLPEGDWLASLVGSFKDPLVMAATGRIVASNVEQSQLPLTPMSGSDANGHRESVFDRKTPFWFERANFGGIGDGGNMAFRRSVFDIWAGFDERLGRGAVIDGGEEHNAFFSLLDRGYRIAQARTAVVHHPVPRDEKEVRASLLRNLACAAAYTVLIFVEHPVHRRAAIRYAFEALRGTTRPWRLPTARPRRRVVSRVRLLLALAHGPLLYYRSLLRQKEIRMPARADAGSEPRPAAHVSACGAPESQ
jgi:O-antigen biosynthesis protein